MPLRRKSVEEVEETEERHGMLWQLPATQLAGLIRSREISAREAVQAALDRLNDVNDAINAVVDHRPEEALTAADVIDARLRDGGVTHVYVVGLAADYCVRATALHANEEGFVVCIVEEGTRPVDVELWNGVREEIREVGVQVVALEGDEVRKVKDRR